MGMSGFLPNAEWGAMNIRNLFACLQVDAKVTSL